MIFIINNNRFYRNVKCIISVFLYLFVLWAFAPSVVKLMKIFSWFAGAFSVCMCFLKLQRVELSRPPYNSDLFSCNSEFIAYLKIQTFFLSSSEIVRYKLTVLRRNVWIARQTCNCKNNFFFTIKDFQNIETWNSENRTWVHNSDFFKRNSEKVGQNWEGEKIWL